MSMYQNQPIAPFGMPPPQSYQQPPRQPMSTEGRKDNYEYSLVVEQQPDRARMCGFGDKDRRPITPPPCVRLIIKDIRSGKEVPASEVSSQFFVLQVDLWSENLMDSVNLVRHSHSSANVSISMATTASYPPPQEPQGYYQGMPYGYPHGQGMMVGAPQQGGQFTRNLIGSATVSSSYLKDMDNNWGLWFILQDLSVRTEGTFRLRFMFTDISNPVAPTTPHSGSCPILATAFSEPFHVWSAKKFPGVKESTPLSKCFAAQGVKIPIRKEPAGNGGRDDDSN